MMGGIEHWIVGGMDPSELQPTVVVDPALAVRAARRGMEVHGPFVPAEDYGRLRAENRELRAALERYRERTP
jgi:hypothetical protein